MAGYNGKKMSNNAIAAYYDGKKPLSKWTKSAILEGITGILENAEVEKGVNFEKLTKEELTGYFLRCTEWHHTGAFYNVTKFYSLDADYIINFSDADFKKIISERTGAGKEKKKQKPEKADQKKDVADVYKKLEVIFYSNSTNLKTFSGIISRFSSRKMDLEAEYKKALEKVEADYLPKIKQWGQLPKDHYRQADVFLFKNDLEQFAQKSLCSGKIPRANSADFKKIEKAL